MERFGQNRSLSGGLQPRVIPAAARALMSAWKIEFWSSEKRSGPSGSWRARRMNAAIWPRVTGSTGQKGALRRGLQPRGMSAARIASLCYSDTAASSATNDRPVVSRPAAGTEAVVAGRVATPGYVGSPDRLDVLLVDRAVVVYERSPRWKLACGWKCSPDDERSDE